MALGGMKLLSPQKGQEIPSLFSRPGKTKLFLLSIEKALVAESKKVNFCDQARSLKRSSHCIGDRSSI
jgi:hypothetical protein